MASIHHRVGIKTSINKVYNALSTIEGVAGWWTENISGESEMGKEMVLQFLTPDGKELGCMRIRIESLDPDKKVVWNFLDGPAEWIGTDVIFELYQDGDYVIVLFTHDKWKEEVEFKSHCSMKWAIFLMSLKHLVENEKGYPSPFDVKIDNWN